MAGGERLSGLILEQAQNLLLERVNMIKDAEEITLWDAGGRVLAKDIYAEHDQPPFPRSPLDGYAVRSADISTASKDHPVRLRVLEEVDAGHVGSRCVEPGTAVRIMTGAPIPDGADCIVGQEDTDYGEETVEVYEPIGSYENYCYAGEDYKAGTKILGEGLLLGAVEVGILASLGLEGVSVYRSPKAAVITTGDEIILPGEELAGGKIYDSNLYTLVTRLRMWGMEVTAKERVGDDAAFAAERIREAAGNADLVITTGGVSVGKKDIMHEVVKILGCETIFWKIAVKPGMPTLCAQYQGKLLICLSGNPYGAAVNLELLVRPLLCKMSGRPDLKIRRVRAVTESTFPKMSRVTRYVRGYYENGKVRIPDGSNASGILSTMCGCNCLIEIPAGTSRLERGDTADIILL
ncbi:MAG: molybdopterin molybdotransferase MoeA [Dorea sp.]|nr:molybdopterin molybdotransferase MoeA [Dorea sp.]